METIELLSVILIGLILLIFSLIIIYVFLKLKNKNNTANKVEESNFDKKADIKNNISYTKESIFDFMEFSKIEDNMIIQKDSKKYLMVIECDGINYDLMSEVEKASVEMGFVQFLNTLRFPVQIHVQTRSINISDSIFSYKQKLQEIYNSLSKKKNQYNRLIQEGYNGEEIRKLKKEIARETNLYEYGEDIVKNIEIISLNKNVLKKHYYIIISYYEEEIGNELLGESEKKNLVFSELYTRAESIIKTLFACSIKGRVLNSYELADLLYVAYNRDDSETYSVKRAIQAGYEDLYSTGEDVLNKKMMALNRRIEEEGKKLALKAIDELKEREIKEKESRLKELINEAAKDILKENKQYLGRDITEEAIKNIEKKTKKGKGVEKDEE